MDAQQYGEEAGLEIMNKATNINPEVFARRKRANKIGLTLSMAAMGLGMIFLFWILSVLVIKGFSSINQVPSGDDDLFINQVATARNTAICIDPDTHTLSEPKNTWNEWMAQKYRHYTTSRYYKPSHKMLLGLYSTSQFLLYPLLIVSIIFYSWWISLAVFGVRFLVQAYVFFKGMKKLNELDLWPLFIVFDIFMFFYYLFTLPAIWKAPRKNWD